MERVVVSSLVTGALEKSVKDLPERSKEKENTPNKSSNRSQRPSARSQWCRHGTALAHLGLSEGIGIWEGYG